MTRRVGSLMVALFLAWPFCVRAAAPSPRSRTEADAALPGGAVARLGDRRWRLLAVPSRIVVSPDGKTLVVATDDSAVTFLDAASGQRGPVLGLFRMPAPRDLDPFADGPEPEPDADVPVAFAPDGKRVAACIGDKDEGPIISIRDGTGRREEKCIDFRKRDRWKPRFPPQAQGAL